MAQFRELGGVGEHFPADQKHFPDIIHMCSSIDTLRGVGGGGGGGNVWPGLP